MAEETLVESLVVDSGAFVRALDAQGDGPTNVLWYYDTEGGGWRLLVAGPTFDQLLPEDLALAYKRVALAIGHAEVDSLTILYVEIVKTDAPVLKATKSVLKTPKNAVVRAHYRNNSFDGMFVKEMLVLRAA
jgi:hypothetical protein